jgi:hypothetical protein
MSGLVDYSSDSSEEEVCFQFNVQPIHKFQIDRSVKQPQKRKADSSRSGLLGLLPPAKQLKPGRSNVKVSLIGLLINHSLLALASKVNAIYRSIKFK